MPALPHGAIPQAQGDHVSMPPPPPTKRRRGRPYHGSISVLPTPVAFCREVRSLVSKALVSEGYSSPDLSPADQPYTIRNRVCIADHLALLNLHAQLTWFMARFLAGDACKREMGS